MNKPTLLDFKVMGGYFFFCFWGTGQFMYLTLHRLQIMFLLPSRKEMTER